MRKVAERALLIAYCRERLCLRQVDLSGKFVERYGDLTVSELRKRLKCGCGSKNVGLLTMPRRGVGRR